MLSNIEVVTFKSNLNLLLESKLDSNYLRVSPPKNENSLIICSHNLQCCSKLTLFLSWSTKGELCIHFLKNIELRI